MQLGTKSLKPLYTRPTFLLGPLSLSIEIQVPKDVLALLSGQIEGIQEEYCSGVHRWMPILSMKHIRQMLSRTASEPRADLALVLLCMKLITDHPMPEDPDWARSALYYKAKSLHRSIKTSKRYSTHFLQAGLLISLYELGHGIYPEAQASVVANAEFGMRLGINEIASQKMSPAPGSWTESEERTRTWWAIMILDRYLSLGYPGRQLITPDPKADHFVPTDDAAWDEGSTDEPVQRKTLVAETIAEPGAGIFERQAHASYLLGQAVTLKLEETQSPHSHIDSAQLGNTLQSLASLLRHDIETPNGNGGFYVAAMGICSSAHFILHSPSSIFNSASTYTLAEKQSEIIKCKQIADRIYYLANMFSENINTPGLVNIIAPLGTDSIYQAAFIYGLLAQESGDHSYHDAYELLRHILAFFDKRWKIAGTYLQLLDSHFSFIRPSSDVNVGVNATRSE